MKRQLLFVLTAILTLGTFFALLISPAEASAAARDALALCGATIIPSLFPFMVISNMIVRSGIAGRLGKALEPLSRRLFGVSGAGGSAFLLGLAGGYPLGAYTVSDLYTGGNISRAEAQRLLRFCNNCGPAFMLTVAGNAVFQSPRAGYFLLTVHAISAFAVGLCSCRKKKNSAGDFPGGSLKHKSLDFSSALTESVKCASLSCLSVCGFVSFFGVLMGLLNALNILPAVCGQISIITGAELRFVRSLIYGFFEIGIGVGSMAGLSINVHNLALCSFVLAWGGLSVQAQAAQTIKESGLSTAPHFLGKLLHGALSTLITVILYPLFF